MDQITSHLKLFMLFKNLAGDIFWIISPKKIGFDILWKLSPYLHEMAKPIF